MADKSYSFVWSTNVSMVLVVLTIILLAPAAGRTQSAEEQAWLVAFQGEVTAVSPETIEIAVGTHGTAFTDRPEREVAVVNIADFVETQWGTDGEFVADPPNASLVDESKGRIAIVEITNADWQDGTLRLMIARLDGRLPMAGDSVAFTVDASFFKFHQH